MIKALVSGLVRVYGFEEDKAICIAFKSLVSHTENDLLELFDIHDNQHYHNHEEGAQLCMT